MNVQPQSPQLKLKLDWKAYYQRFSEQHGGNPIIYKGRQLFSDGWTYSITDYAGPEWPPPKDLKEFASLKKVYWYTRWNRAKNELVALRDRFVALKGLQSEKSVPLQQVIVEKDSNGKSVKHTSDWCPNVFEHLIRFLEIEVETANSELEKLKEMTNGHFQA
jgi:hypothetical protein